MKKNFYWEAREWSYKNVKRCVFAEQYIEDEGNHNDLLTYKFLCFDGKPNLCYVTVKNDNIWENYYDMDFMPLDIHREWTNCENSLNKPSCFDDMKRVAAELSQGLKHVRLDLYKFNEQVRFLNIRFMIGVA